MPKTRCLTLGKKINLIEGYINDGDRVFTAQVFPEKNPAVGVFRDGTGAIIHDLRAWNMLFVILYAL